MKKIEELNKLLEEIFNKFDLITRAPSDDFVDDYTIYTSILYDKYEKVDLNFWNYFKNKYSLPEVEVYFKDSYDLLKTVFDQCLRPFYLRLDVLPNYRKKYYSLSSEFEKHWIMKRFFSNNWISILSIILMTLFFMLAINSEIGSLNYNIFLSLATGILISLIISSINYAHKKRLRKKKAEINRIFDCFEILHSKYKDIRKTIMTNNIEENSVFVREFCVFNNAINDFLEKTKNIVSLQSSPIYHWFRDFEKEIFDFSSKIVKKDFKRYLMDQTTNEEVGILQKYVIQFGYWINAFEMDLLSLKYDYGRDIKKMEDKTM